MKPPSQVSLSSSRTTDKVELFQIALVDLRGTGELMNGNPAVVSVETGDGSIHLPRTSIAEKKGKKEKTFILFKLWVSRD